MKLEAIKTIGWFLKLDPHLDVLSLYDACVRLSFQQPVSGGGCGHMDTTDYREEPQGG